MSLKNLRALSTCYPARRLAGTTGCTRIQRPPHPQIHAGTLARGLIIVATMGVVLPLSMPALLSAQEASSADRVAGGDASEDRLFIEVKQTAVRAEPKVWSRALLTLQFGDEVRAVTSPASPAVTDGGTPGTDWIRVRVKDASHGQASLEGFVHRTALTRRVVVLKGSTTVQQVSANEQEVVLAAKGFSADVENHYRRAPGASGQVAQLDEAYAQIDLIESTLQDSPAELERFMREGGFAL